LVEAAGLAASPQLRNMATIGGNLLQRPRCWYFRSSHFPCWLKGGAECFALDGENQYHALFHQGPCVAAHPSDPAAALLAYDASVAVRGPAGERVVPLDAFFAEPEEARRTETTLRPDEIVTEIRIPAPAPGSRGRYLKAMDRKVWAFALVGVAVVLTLREGKIGSPRVVLAGVAPVPHRALAAEAVLAGAAPSAALFTVAADAALAAAQPLDRNEYKVPLARALIARALAEVCAT
jgi:xanthine dehydrogenase YagS FAD-binding subunit